MKKALVLCLGVMALLSGCGLVVRSSQGGFVRQTVVAKSLDNNKKLEGISVYVNGTLEGFTDAKGRLKVEIPAPRKGDKVTIRLEKEGYLSQEKEFSAQVDGGFVVGDVFLGLLTGVLIDGVTDGWLSYPRTVTLRLQPR